MSDSDSESSVASSVPDSPVSRPASPDSASPSPPPSPPASPSPSPSPPPKAKAKRKSKAAPRRSRSASPSDDEASEVLTHLPKAKAKKRKSGSSKKTASSSKKKTSSKKSKRSEPAKEKPQRAPLTIGRSRPDPPLRYVFDEENFERHRLWAFWSAQRETYRSWENRMKHEKSDELARINRGKKKERDQTATLQDYKKFLRSAPNKDFKPLDGVWLSACSWDGMLSAEQIAAGERVEGDEVLMLLYKETLRHKYHPLGIVSESSLNVKKEKGPNGKERVVSFDYKHQLPEGEDRVYCGDAIHLREAWSVAHPLALRKSAVVKHDKTPETLLEIGAPYRSK